MSEISPSPPPTSACQSAGQTRGAAGELDTRSQSSALAFVLSSPAQALRASLLPPPPACGSRCLFPPALHPEPGREDLKTFFFFSQ